MESSSSRSSVFARIASCVTGGLIGAMLTGLLFAIRSPTNARLALAWRLAAMLVVPGLVIGVACALFVTPWSSERLARVRAAVLDRPSALAALLLLVPPAGAVWIGLASFAGRHFLTAYHHVGLASFAQAVALLALTLTVMGVTAALARVVTPHMPAPTTVFRAVWWPLLMGVALAIAIAAHGVWYGDMHGHSRPAALLMGGYGVLKKPELDLTPVAMLASVAALTALVGFALRRVSFVALPVALVAAVVLLHRASTDFGNSPVAADLDARPGLPRLVLRALRARTDGDHDGFSRAFGGGDCDDHDPQRNPGAVDRPGDGIDQDCSGADARRVLAAVPTPAPSPAPAPAPTPSVARPWNLVLITVDTMRAETHVTGYAHPITPRFDALAATSVVFDRAYAISSYTGRAIGPMMTGRYPTECARDGEHFTRYAPSNVFLAERLKDLGFRTFGVASHFYFERRFGLAQGIDIWDLSAKPEGDGQETTSADAQVADRAIALLRDPQNTTGRFFAWVHFFDPHKQYVAHNELPLFARGERGRYDREVMHTDAQIGRVIDALQALPGGVYDRTIVVITSDHGEAFGEHGLSYHGVELWEELVRVPLLIRVPGVAPRRVTTPRGQIDLVPTLCELLAVAAPAREAPDAFSGQSLVGDFAHEQPERPIYIELPEGPYNSLRRSVLFEGYKLTERGVGRWQLFNLGTDPGERSDLAATDATRLARMRAVMEEVRSGLHVVAAPPPRARAE